MSQQVLPRPPPIPASPHIKPSYVLQMVQDESGGRGRQPWPPVRELPGAPRPHEFLAKYNIEGGKKIAWPPHLSSTEDLTSDNQEGTQEPSRSIYQDSPRNQNEGGPNLTTAYPSSFKLKEEAPMDHISGTSVVPSQPAFKITQPMKVRGDDKWPPRKYAEDTTQENVREFVKPKKGNRDYSEFFAQNALPNSYPAYRAPPGTQHRGVDE